MKHEICDKNRLGYDNVDSVVDNDRQNGYLQPSCDASAIHHCSLHHGVLLDERISFSPWRLVPGPFPTCRILGDGCEGPFAASLRSKIDFRLSMTSMGAHQYLMPSDSVTEWGSWDSADLF